MAEPVLLVGDIGGTNARFALADRQATGFSRGLNLATSDYPGIGEALRDYIGRVGASRPEAICLAGAGPVSDGRIQITNNHWTIDSRDINAAFGPARIRLINDFEAVAHALPLLRPDHLMALGEDLPSLPAGGNWTVAVLGPGTGLGVAGLIGRSGVIQPITGEGGHVGFSPASDDQDIVFRHLRERYGRVHTELVVSGPGLESSYAALRAAAGETSRKMVAAEIFQRAEAGGDRYAERTVALFFEVLGQVAGDLALLLGAWDGVFIAGGIAPRYAALMAESRFRAGFENKGVFAPMMRRIPSALVLHPDPGLLGASQCVRELLA